MASDRFQPVPWGDQQQARHHLALATTTLAPTGSPMITALHRSAIPTVFQEILAPNPRLTAPDGATYTLLTVVQLDFLSFWYAITKQLR